MLEMFRPSSLGVRFVRAKGRNMNTDGPEIPDFCDMCGCDLDACELEYRVRIDVVSGDLRRDPGEDLQADPAGEITRLIEAAASMSEAELMDGVYRRMEFRICPACQKKYIKDPIPRNFSKGQT